MHGARGVAERVPGATWLREDLADSTPCVLELIQKSLVMALVVQQHAGSCANNQEVHTQGQARDIAWGSWGGHLECTLALFLASVMNWVHRYSPCQTKMFMNAGQAEPEPDTDRSICVPCTRTVARDMCASGEVHVITRKGISFYLMLLRTWGWCMA